MRLSIPMLAFALLTAGFLWPTEEAINGLGLHLTVAWILLGLLQSVQRWMAVEQRRTPIDWMDLGVLLIVLGHVVSTLFVFHVSGDRRAALNLTFEWIALLIAWRIFRSLFQDPQIAAQGIAVLIAICVGLSCYGIWQHHWYYAEQSEWYLSLRRELDQALTGDDPPQFNRVREITRQFQERGIPLSGSSRLLWENRLLSSSEPFATFSLGNTLAGILATGLVLLIGQVSSTRGNQRRTSWLGTILLVIQISVIAYCLILTKSRSAWLGTCVGSGILLIQRIRLSAVQHAFRWFVRGSLIAAMAVGIAAVTGGVDKEVILESLRSLQFRSLYWSGTARMLRDQPFAGAGPGNFRQVYLRYKLDETSEEVRDPHNIVLDAWSSSGLIGLSGLLLIIGCAGWRLWNRRKAADAREIVSDQKPPAAQRGHPFRIVTAGFLGGFILHLIWNWLNGSDEWTSEPTRLLLLAGLMMLMARGSASFRPLDSAACLAAASTMMVNLLAAGGFEMPAVMITLLTCLAAGIACKSAPARACGPGWDLLTAGVLLATFLFVVGFGLLPVTVSEYHVRAGTLLIAGTQNPSRALDHFRQAIQADPQSVTPRQRMAEVLSYRLSEAAVLRQAATGRVGMDEADRRLADDALDACESLLSADRRNSFSYQLRAEVRWNAAVMNGADQMWNLAIQDLQTAASLYPSSVAVWYQLAERLASAGVQHNDAAKAAAERALQLDRINHTWGHSDRYLTDEQHEIVGRIAGLLEE